MLTRLLNHLIGIYPSQSSRDNRGGLLKTVSLTPRSGLDNVPGRVEVWSPKRISRQQIFDFGSRQLNIDHIIYTEATPVINGDFVKWLPPAGANQYFRIEAVITFPAQGTLPTYYVIGALEIQL